MSQNYDDEKMPDGESLSKMRESYSKLSPHYSGKVRISAPTNTNIDPELADEFRRNSLYIDEVMRRLPQNHSLRPYLSGLKDLNESELSELAGIYEEFSDYNSRNPVVLRCRSGTVNRALHEYIYHELQMIDALFSIYNTETNESNRRVLARIISRRIKSLLYLMGTWHINCSNGRFPLPGIQI